MTEPLSSHIKKAWHIYKPNWKFIVPVAIVSAVVSIALNIVSKASERSILASLIVTVASLIVGLVITLGWSQLGLKLAHGGHATWKDFKTMPKTWLNYFIARFFMGLISAGIIIVAALPILGALAGRSRGLAIAVIIVMVVAAIVALIWLSIRFMFISFIAVEHPNTGGWAMIKSSARMTKGHTGKLFLFGLLLVLLNICGAIALLIGLLVTVPVSIIAVALVYGTLRGTMHDQVHHNSAA